MFGRLFLLFTLVPLVELALLIRIGEWMGVLPTVALVVTTGIVGAALARREGIKTWGRVQDELGAGRVPGGEMLHALMVVVAGAFLVTPGVLTDVAGLSLLVRPVRSAVIDRVRQSLEARVQEGSVRVFGPGDLGVGRSGDRSSPPESSTTPEPPEGPDGWYRRESDDRSER